MNGLKKNKKNKKKQKKQRKRWGQSGRNKKCLEVFLYKAKVCVFLFGVLLLLFLAANTRLAYTVLLRCSRTQIYVRE